MKNEESILMKSQPKYIPATSWGLWVGAAVVAGMSSLFLLSCAEKKTRLWIDPPPRATAQGKSTQKIYYQVEDSRSGKKESLAIPIEQAPQTLVVEDRRIAATGSQKAGAPEESSFAATQADRLLREEKLPEDANSESPSVSLLRGLQEVEDLYGQKQFTEALVRITPLIEQYPKRARLYAMQGTLLKKVGEKKMAIRAYQRAHELEPGNAQIDEAYQLLQDELGVIDESQKGRTQ